MTEVFSYIASISISPAGSISLMALIIHAANETRNSVAKGSTANRSKRFYRNPGKSDYKSFAASRTKLRQQAFESWARISEYPICIAKSNSNLAGFSVGSAQDHVECGFIIAEHNRKFTYNPIRPRLECASG
jgi:hypothetical protein